MKILHIGKYYPPFSGGIENFLHDLMISQAASGLTVAAIVHNHDPSVRHTIRETDNSVAVYRVPCLGSLVYAPVSPGFLFALKYVIQQFRPDIIHVHMPNTSGFWLLFLPGIRHIPLVVHWHSDVVQSGIDTRLKFAYPFYQPFEQKLLKIASTVIVTSQPYLKTSTALKNWQGKTHVIPLGLDRKDLCVPHKTRAWAENVWGKHAGARLLCVGRLTYYKGHHKLIRAAAVVPEARVVIVGKGELMNSLKAAVHRHKAGRRITLMGALDTDRLDALFDSANCLVLPSTERTEAFGVVLLEAMRAGIPAIVFDIPGSGAGWVVQHKVTGMKVPLGNETLLSQAIKIMTDNPQYTLAMGRNARNSFQKKFHISQITRSISHLYTRIAI